jgi:hypothetical protein
MEKDGREQRLILKKMILIQFFFLRYSLRTGLLMEDGFGVVGVAVFVWTKYAKKN